MADWLRALAASAGAYKVGDRVRVKQHFTCTTGDGTFTVSGGEVGTIVERLDVTTYRVDLDCLGVTIRLWRGVFGLDLPDLADQDDVERWLAS